MSDNNSFSSGVLAPFKIPASRFSNQASSSSDLPISKNYSRPKAKQKNHHQASSTISNSSSTNSRILSSPSPINPVKTPEDASLFNMDTESVNPSSASLHISSQADTQVQSSGLVDTQVHSSDQADTHGFLSDQVDTQMQMSGEELEETHLFGHDDRQTHFVSRLTDSVHKAMSIMSHANCADEINRKFIEEIMEQVEDMAKDNRYRSESTKAQLDALGTRLWNSALIIRADAGENAQQEIVSAIAFICRTACLLLSLCRLEKEDIESSLRVVTVCARTAMDLFKSDERVMAEEMIGMAAECVEPLEKIDTDAGVFDDDYKDSVFEAVCAYRLARFQLSAGKNDAVMSHFMNKALSSCKKLRSDCWVSRATIKFSIELAVKVIEEQEKTEDDVQKDATKLQEVKIFLENVHFIIDKKPYADSPAYIRSRSDVAFLLSRVQYITGKLNGREETKVAAEETLSYAVKQAKAANQKVEASKASLLIMSMMEERKADLVSMLQQWQDIVPELDFEGSSIDTIVKILFRTLARKPNHHSEYILRVVSEICQCMLTSRLDKVSCATHIGKLGFLAVKAAGLECTNQLNEFFNRIYQSDPPIQLSEEMGYAWLDALLKSANNDESSGRKEAIELLRLASHPILAKPENTAYLAVKKAAYLLMQAGRFDECNQLLMEQVPDKDLPTSLLLCISFIRQRKEVHASKILEEFDAGKWNANLLLWIVSEAFAQGMTNLQTRAMMMFLTTCPPTDHGLNNIRMLRTVVTKYIDFLQKIDNAEEVESIFNTLLELVGRYDTILFAASHEDKQSKEKADEANWIIASLYKLTIDSENKLTAPTLDNLNRTIVKLVDHREMFEDPCHPQIYLLRFYAGFRSLLDFKKSISATRQTMDTEDNLLEAWRQALKCERDLSSAMRASNQFSEARENDKLAIVSIKVELLLEMQKNQEVKNILEREKDPLDYESVEEIAQLILQHPRSEPFVLQAAVKRLIGFYKVRAQTHGSYPANEVAEWLRHVMDRLFRRTHSLIYTEIIELLGDLMIPLWKDSGFIANPPWPIGELIFFQNKAREMAYDLAKQGRREPAFQLGMISSEILQGIPELPKEAYDAENQRLAYLEYNLQRSQDQVF